MGPSQRYSFVNAHPQTKAEKLEARVAIRSHIGRWTQEIQQRHYSSNVKADADSSRATSQASPSSSPQSVLSQSGSISLADRARRVASDNDDNDNDEQEEENALSWKRRTARGLELAFGPPSSSPSDLCSLSNGASPDSIERVLSGSWDPFQTYPPSFLPPSRVSECNDYSLRVVWPGLTPASMTSPSAAVLGWFPMALHDTTAFASLLFGSLSHRRLRLLKNCDRAGEVWKTNMDLELRRCETTAIGLINMVLQDPHRELSDALILSVLCLAANAWDMTPWESAAEPVFDPPLKSLQWLDLYGFLQAHPVHAAGLLQLVALRGGLQNIKTPGLAATISFFGIISASRLLTYPVFPFISLLDGGDDDIGLGNWSSLRPRDPNCELDFSRLANLGLTTQLSMVLGAMQQYEDSARLYSDGVLAGLEPASMCDQRNLIQYRLLSLAPPENSAQFSRSHPIFEPIRLAALIYSLTVIFPILPPAAPLDRLTRDLKSALRESDLRASWANTAEAQCLIVWALVIGGVAARDLSEERMWFIAALGRLTAPTSIRQFEDLKLQVLKNILWLDQACDAAGRSLWAEILELGG